MNCGRSTTFKFSIFCLLRPGWLRPIVGFACSNCKSPLVRNNMLGFGSLLDCREIMAKWILTIFVISSSPNISWTDLVYRRYAVFEIIVTRIFSHNSNLSFSSSLVSSCIPLLTMASYQETGMTKMAAVFFLMIIHYSSVISSLFIQARPGPVKTLLMIISNKH